MPARRSCAQPRPSSIRRRNRKARRPAAVPRLPVSQGSPGRRRAVSWRLCAARACRPARYRRRCRSRAPKAPCACGKTRRRRFAPNRRPMPALCDRRSPRYRSAQKWNAPAKPGGQWMRLPARPLVGRLIGGALGLAVARRNGFGIQRAAKPPDPTNQTTPSPHRTARARRSRATQKPKPRGPIPRWARACPRQIISRPNKPFFSPPDLCEG